jgi:hypothetical protein
LHLPDRQADDAALVLVRPEGSIGPFAQPDAANRLDDYLRLVANP